MTQGLAESSGRRPLRLYPGAGAATTPEDHSVSQSQFSDLVADIQTALRRSLTAVVGITLAATLLAVIAALNLNPKYEALGRLIIDQSLGSASGTARRVDFFGDAMIIDSEVESLLSRDLLANVGERLGASGIDEPFTIGASADEEARQEAIDTLEDGLSIERVDSTFVIDIRFEAEDPRHAALVVNTLMDEFRIWRQTVLMTYMGEAGALLEQQIDASAAEVAQAERRVENFMAEFQMQSPANLSVLEERIADTAEDLIRTESILKEIDGDLAAVRRVQSDIEGITEADLDDLATLTDIETVNLRPLVRQLQQLLAADGGPTARRDLVSQIADRLRRYEATLEGRRASVLPTVTSLRETRSQLNQELAQYRSYLVDLRGLERQAEALAARHVALLGQLQNTRQETNLVINPARVLQTAVPPLQPTGLGPKSLIAVAIVAGLLAGIAFALLREQIDGSFRTSRQLQAITRSRILGSIPMIARNALRRTPLLDGLEGDGLSQAQRDDLALFSYAARHPGSRVAKAFDQGAFAIGTGYAPPAVISVISALGGDGKSFYSSNLGFVLAARGHRVLLVDADQRNRALTKALGPASSAATSEVMPELAARGAEIRQVWNNLHLMQNSSDNDLDAGDMATFLHESRQAFDYVIVDTPPLAFMPDTAEFVRESDASILIVKWGSTRMSLVARLLEQNPSVSTSLMGAVYSQADPRLQDRYEHLPGGHNYYVE